MLKMYTYYILRRVSRFAEIIINTRYNKKKGEIIKP